MKAKWEHDGMRKAPTERRVQACLVRFVAEIVTSVRDAPRERRPWTRRTRRETTTVGRQLVCIKRSEVGNAERRPDGPDKAESAE